MTRRLCLVGASGRMGRRVLGRLSGHPGLALGSLLVHETALEGQGGVRQSADAKQAFTGIDVVLDFSAPAAAASLLPIAADLGCAYVLASTGLEPKDETAIAAAARRIPVLAASNFSVGVQVLAELVRAAAARLGEGFDPELFELHHKGKRDAPSGTANRLANEVRAARPDTRVVFGRSGARQAGELGEAALRGGDVPGEHTVFFLGQGERLELTHRAGSADIFADGALRAAAWLAGRPAGRYDFASVLGPA